MTFYEWTSTEVPDGRWISFMRNGRLLSYFKGDFRHLLPWRGYWFPTPEQDIKAGNFGGN